MTWGERLVARDTKAGGQAAPLSVRRARSGWAVFRGDEQISGVNAREYCEFMAEGLARILRRRQRACLCCGSRFESDGPGHRLCDGCRAGRGLPSAQFEGW
jgi:hypothetical protein